MSVKKSAKGATVESLEEAIQEMIQEMLDEEDRNELLDKQDILDDLLRERRQLTRD